MQVGKYEKIGNNLSLACHSKASVRQTVIIDAGISDKDNLALIREKGYEYVCVTRRWLTDYCIDKEKHNVVDLTDRSKSQLSLKIFTTEGYNTTRIHAQSPAKSTSVNQFAIVFGMLVVYFVNYFIAEYSKDSLKNVHENENRNIVCKALDVYQRD